MAATTTSRSMALLRQRGYTVARVEVWNPHVGIRQDLFNFADLIAIRGDRPGVLAVQVTTAGHRNERFEKIINLPPARTWLQAGNRIHVHGWIKHGGRWECLRREVTLEDMKVTEESPDETTHETT